MARSGRVSVGQVLVLPLICIFFSRSVQLVDSEPHFLRYIYSAFATRDDLIEFVAQGLVDGIQIDYYDSHTQKKVPKQPWMEKNMEPGYWERGTQSRNSKQHWFKVNTRILMDRTNTTSGRHTLQWTHGCKKNDDGIIEGFDQYAYDGKDFLAFEKDHLRWTAADSAALITRDKWDGEKSLNQYTRRYLEQECVEWLQNFLKFSNGVLERKVTPETKIYRKRRSLGGEHVTVSCHASGFYPQDIRMKWFKNDTMEEQPGKIEIVPNYDDTFQAWLDIEVDPEHSSEYVCHVNHSSFSWTHYEILDPDILKDETGSSSIMVIVAVIVILLLSVIAGAGAWWFLKKRGKTVLRDTLCNTETDKQAAVPLQETVISSASNGSEKHTEEAKVLLIGNADSEDAPKSSSSSMSSGYSSSDANPPKTSE